MRSNRVLFVSLANDIGSERAVASMASQGVECAVLSPPCFFAALTSGCMQCFPLPTRFGIWPRSMVARRRLQQAVETWRPAMILPLDDVAARLLRGLARDQRVSEPLRALLVQSLGDQAGYDASITRLGLMTLAGELGLRKPNHLPVRSKADLETAAGTWGFPIVHKLENTCGGSGVTIIRNKAGLDAALRGPPLLKRLLAAGKAAVKRRLEISVGFPSSSKNSDILQSFVEGKPAMCSVAAWNGEVLGMLSLAAERVYPEATGASTVVKPIENEEMSQTAKVLVQALGCHGLVSFDFVIDQEGRAFLIELNPRAVGTMHLSAIFGTDLCGLLAEKLGGKSVQRAAHRNHHLSVALFPKELLRDPDSPYIARRDVIHDVPWDDASMISAYMDVLRAAHGDQSDKLLKAVNPASSATARKASAARSLMAAC